MAFLMPVIGVLIVVCSVSFYLRRVPNIVFDKATGYYWQNHRAPHETPQVKHLNNSCKLADIHALQLIKRPARSEHGNPFWVYQLNLVLKNGRRMNVTTRAEQAVLRQATRMLAEFLNRPVWDAI